MVIRLLFIVLLATLSMSYPMNDEQKWAWQANNPEEQRYIDWLKTLPQEQQNAIIQQLLKQGAFLCIF